MRNYPLLRSQGELRMLARAGKPEVHQLSLSLGRGLWRAVQIEAQAANCSGAELLRAIMSDWLRDPWEVLPSHRGIMQVAIADRDAIPMRLNKRDWTAIKRLALDRDISASELLQEILWSWFQLGLPIEKRGQRLEDFSPFEIQSKRLASGILLEFKSFEFPTEVEARAALEKLKSEEKEELGRSGDFDQSFIWFLKNKEDGTRVALEGVDLRKD